VLTYAVMEERLGADYGYLRVRVELVNRDFVEMAEYFTVQTGGITVQRYRHQWMDPTQQVLRKRWDNARHHPHLASFPHHVHDGNESNVIPGTAMRIIDAIAYLEATIVDLRND
jgi:hypothetical protein